MYSFVVPFLSVSKKEAWDMWRTRDRGRILSLNFLFAPYVAAFHDRNMYRQPKTGCNRNRRMEWSRNGSNENKLETFEIHYGCSAHDMKQTKCEKNTLAFRLNLVRDSRGKQSKRTDKTKRNKRKERKKTESFKINKWLLRFVCVNRLRVDQRARSHVNTTKIWK